MPKSLYLLSSITLILLLNKAGGKTVSSSLLGFKEEKLTHFRVYWHDITKGKNQSSIQILKPSQNYSTTTAFGLVHMIDDPLTLGPKLTSKMVGRAQGLYAAASQEEVEFLMAMNFAFIDGKYNGSTFNVFGRNTISKKVREMPVIGGSGLFRFARGYVEARTQWVDVKTRNAVVEYNCYVLHY